MTITCPHCSKNLKLNDKIRASVQNLPTGQSLRLKCPHCENTIFCDADSLPGSQKMNEPPQSSDVPGELRNFLVKPPSPPDITWLKDGVFNEEEAVEDIPQALVLVQPGESRDLIAKAVESIGYQPTFAQSATEAMEKMQFVTYAGVILHSQFEGGGLDQSSFHQYMRKMGMEKRRFIFYILVGPSFFTLYDLEALANSANLVVNEKELPDFLTILRKAIPQYEELFGTLMAELSAFGG